MNRAKLLVGGLFHLSGSGGNIPTNFEQPPVLQREPSRVGHGSPVETPPMLYQSFCTLLSEQNPSFCVMFWVQQSGSWNVGGFANDNGR
jgi:hypothetical protein